MKSTKKFLFPLLACALLTGYACVDPVDEEEKCTGQERRCKNASTVQLCSKGSWVDHTCTGPTPVCDAGNCVAAPAKCTNGTKQCKNNTTIQTCENEAWVDSTCPAATPVCNNNQCMSAEEAKCTNGAKQCLNSTTAQTCTNEAWVDKACTGATPVCKDGDCVAGSGGLPADVPSSCIKGTSPAVCSTITGNAYFCGDTGYYLSAAGTCTADKKCIVCPDGFGGCGITCSGTGELPADVPSSCVKGTSPAVCSTITGNAYFCGDTGYYLSAAGTCTADKKCIVCPDGFGGCGITCKDPADNCPTTAGAACTTNCTNICTGNKGYYCASGSTRETACPGTTNCIVTPGNRTYCQPNADQGVPATCNYVSSTNRDPAVCGKDGHAYFCNQGGVYGISTTGGQIGCTTAAPCYVCNDGWGGCSATPATECAARGGVKFPAPLM